MLALKEEGRTEEYYVFDVYQGKQIPEGKEVAFSSVPSRSNID